MAKEEREPEKTTAEDIDPDWNKDCSSCGSTPIIPITGMCEPCSWGQIDFIEEAA